MAGKIKIDWVAIPEIWDYQLSAIDQGGESFNRIHGTTSRTHNRVMTTSVYEGFHEADLTTTNGDLFAEGRIRIRTEGMTRSMPLYTISNSKIIRPILQYTVTTGSRIISTADRSAMAFAMAGGGGSGGTGTNNVLGTGGSGGGGGGFAAGYITTGQVDAIRPYLSLSVGAGGKRPTVHSTHGNYGGDSVIMATNSYNSITEPIHIATTGGGHGGSGGAGTGGNGGDGNIDHSSTSYVKHVYVSKGGAGGSNRKNGSAPSNTATRSVNYWQTMGRLKLTGRNFGDPIAQLAKSEYADTYISGNDVAGGGGGGGGSRVPYSPSSNNGAGGRGGDRRAVSTATSGNSGFISIFF